MATTRSSTHSAISDQSRSDSDIKWCVAIFGLVVVCGLCWLSFELAGIAQFHHYVAFRGRSPLDAVIWLVSPSKGEKSSVTAPIERPNIWWWRSVFIMMSAGTIAVGLFAMKMTKRRTQQPNARLAHWADHRELSPLLVNAPQCGRVVVGRFGRHLVAMEPRHSVMVIGPTQSGKTSGFVIPAMLEWQGPVIATSVKTDLIRATYTWRSSLGDVAIYDPSGVSGFPANCWSPLSLATTWPGAKRAASGLCSVARAGSSGLDDAAFWYAIAEKLIAPLLFAAASSGATMMDVIRWVDTEEVDEVLDALSNAGVEEATQFAVASFRRDERQRSSVSTTAETILAAFANSSNWTSFAPEIDPASIVNGGSNTLYLVAPTHEQERLQSAFVALLRSVIEAAYTKSSRVGQPLDPPLLVVLDEAANIAPLNTLDSVASVAASHGIQLLTVWQDMAQITARYGGKATTVVNNHRAKLICSGVSDPGTLEQMSALIGDEEHFVDSSSHDRHGGRTTTRSPATRRLAPVDAIRRLSPREAVLLYGHLAPARLRLRPYYSEADLARRSGLDVFAGTTGRSRDMESYRYSPKS